MRWTSSIFVLVYLVATFQITIDMRFCGDELIDLSFRQGVQENVTDDYVCQHDCCSTDFVVIAIEDDQQTCASTQIEKPIFTVVPFFVVTDTDPNVDLIQEPLLEPRAGPLLSSIPDLYTLYCNYTLYS